MPAALHIMSAKKGDLTGLAKHALRLGNTSSSRSFIDPSKSDQNKYVQIKPADLRLTTPGAQWKIYEDGLAIVKPVRRSSGKRLEKNAVWTANMVATLPIEIDATNDEAVREWGRVTLRYIDELPGKTLYAAIHMDETTPHLHVSKLAVDDDGYLNYREMYSKRGTFKKIQATYSEALKPLGVIPNSPAVKRLKAKKYVPDVEMLKTITRAEQQTTYLQQVSDALKKRAAYFEKYIAIGANLEKLGKEAKSIEDWKVKAGAFISQCSKYFIKRPSEEKRKSNDISPR